MYLKIFLLQRSTGTLGNYQSFIPMMLIILVFYFFMIRPQVRKQKEHKKYIEALKKGDRIVTTAGIHGKIVDITEATFLVEVDHNVKIHFDKSAIALDTAKASSKSSNKV